MFEICIFGFLVVSGCASLFLWLTFAAAKRADLGLREMDETGFVQRAGESFHLKRPLPSADD